MNLLNIMVDFDKFQIVWTQADKWETIVFMYMVGSMFLLVVTPILYFFTFDKSPLVRTVVELTALLNSTNRILKAIAISFIVYATIFHSSPLLMMGYLPLLGTYLWWVLGTKALHFLKSSVS